MDLGLGGKVAVVTGGASGIGRETARRLAVEGARVGVLDLDGHAAARVAEEVGGAGAACDVTDAASVEAAVGRVRDALGPPDVLVCCAGVWHWMPFLDMPLDKARREIEVNLLGVVHACRAVAPHLIEKQGGRIVCVASDAGRMGEKGMASYAASKAGVIAWCKSLARELGRHWVTVNVVCPSFTETAMTAHVDEETKKAVAKAHPLRRLGRPEDIADAILFLVSARASWITGQTLSVDGGYVMA